MTGCKLSLAWISIVALLATPALALAEGQNPKGILVEVSGFRSDNGKLGCSIFSGPDGFPRNRSKALAHTWGTPIQNRQAKCFFGNLPAGTYAVTLFHDENGDGKFNSNFFGYPLEGFGFSNNVNPTVRAPSFDETAVQYDGNGVKKISIQMIYK